MRTFLSPLLAIGPFGTTELLILAALFLIFAGGIAGIVFLVIHLNKKK
jgi:hypothetical protein